MLRVAVIAAFVVVLVPLAGWLYYERFANPRAMRELLEQPDGERAAKVMLITLPSGRRIPVNYLREGDTVYAGADGRWWKELVGDGAPVEVVIHGETHVGLGRAVRDDPEYTARVFRRLRPNALEGFGTLVEIRLAEPPA